eukprot:CAMPEP_0177784326 /NCGR_PEP_ID=MMETSP0491_2-20121128/19636_1 /TAXON_ID=63592 /ORGANISM="Tetraselmis chuii, Strain PLY429" /LENGTH=601 /DNA_ID=CAMNT_0019305075 /DNA_START=1038 /DNA_END=2843 /DNA_ORIENTATION=+
MLEEAAAAQADGKSAFSAELAAARRAAADLRQEIERETADLRARLEQELLAVRKPGGKDPRIIVHELEELRREHDATKAALESGAKELDRARAEAAELQGALDGERAARATTAAEKATVEAELAKATNSIAELQSTLAQKRAELEKAGEQRKEVDEAIKAERTAHDTTHGELATMKRRLQEQLGVTSDKAVAVAKLEGQVDSLRGKLRSTEEESRKLAAESATATLKALRSLRRKYFDIVDAPVPPGAKGGQGSGARHLNRRNSTAAAGSSPVATVEAGKAALDARGILLPSGLDRDKELDGGWLAMKLTARGVDPAGRDWVKRVEAEWAAGLDAGDGEEPMDDSSRETEPEERSKARGRRVAREVLRLEACLLSTFQEALRDGGPHNQQHHPPNNANQFSSPPSRQLSRATSASAGRANSRAGGAGDGGEKVVDVGKDVASMLERRLRGARERVERIRTEATHHHEPHHASPVDHHDYDEVHQVVAADEFGTGDYGEVLAVLDVLGSRSSASPAAAAADDHHASPTTSAATASSPPYQVRVPQPPSMTGPSAYLDHASVPSGRPHSASQQRRIQYEREFNYGGGGAPVPPSGGRPEWQDS